MISVESSINIYLLLGGVLSFLASFAHLGINVGGAKWYRFFGAGEKFASASEQGKWFPALITFGIALVLAGWGWYAFSGAGIVTPLPFLKIGLSIITAIYLIRGIAGFGVLFVKSEYSPQFIVISSVICLLFGLVHLIGLVQIWKVV
jgi:hypothetical protein